jgi:hypothetical protein
MTPAFHQQPDMGTRRNHVNRISRHLGLLLAAAPALLLGLPAAAFAQAAAPAAAAPSLEDAELIGAGRLTAYRLGNNTLVAVPASAMGKLFLWYTEVVGVPAGMVANAGLEIGSSLARFERVGDILQVRDLSTQVKRRAGMSPPERPPRPTSRNGKAEPGTVQGATPNDPKLRPIDVALNALEVGALIASFPIVGTQADGTMMVDVTPTFSSDIPAATGRGFVSDAGLVPVAVDPAKSYVDRVRVSGEVLNIRSHLTFMVGSPAMPAIGPQPVSIVLGHSLVFLPEQPMRPRAYDPRVGFFPTEYTQFESDRGTAQEKKTLIARFRLEKKDPQAAVSDPVKPITFYIGPGVPERWRPYVAAGVRQWLPVFEAAGFSNAIRAVDAPTPQQDPNWSAEDVTLNVIRWVPEERANAMGPHVIDPRSGETLSAHVLIWPGVIDTFGQYYWAMFGGGVDPAATRLPLSQEKSGAILSYIVAHEVGHTLGLMHNHMASTAHTVAQLRNPAFANKAGPNSSIMAYGRFNHVAQPGDGVTQLWGVVGPYDYAAIRYGYADFGSDPAAERRALASLADGFMADRRLFWGTEESGEFINRFGRDPRVQTENVGAERVEATRLGVANVLRSLKRLDAATAGDAELYASTYAMLLSRHTGLLKSVKRVVAASLPPLGRSDGPLAGLVPAAEQRKAVNFVLGEGVASLDAYRDPAVVERVSVYGGYRAIDRLQAGFVEDMLNGPNVALLESQRRRDPAAYSSLDLGRDVSTAVWGPLSSTNATQRAVQRGYIDAARKLLDAWAGGGASEAAQAKSLEAMQVSSSAAGVLVESGDDTIFIPWLRSTLPDLKSRLEAASSGASGETDRLHFADMAVQVGRLLKVGAP